MLSLQELKKMPRLKPTRTRKRKKMPRLAKKERKKENAKIWIKKKEKKMPRCVNQGEAK